MNNTVNATIEWDIYILPWHNYVVQRFIYYREFVDFFSSEKFDQYLETLGPDLPMFSLPWSTDPQVVWSISHIRQVRQMALLPLYRRWSGLSNISFLITARNVERPITCTATTTAVYCCNRYSVSGTQQVKILICPAKLFFL